MYPNRFCKEEDWVSRTKVLDYSCRHCRRERRERNKERLERAKYGDGYYDGGLTESQRREREAMDVEDEGRSDFDSTASESDSDSALIFEEDDKTPSGVWKKYFECDCSAVFYEGGKLQGCFEQKQSSTQIIEEPPSTQTTEKPQIVSDSAAPRGTKRRRSPAIDVPAQSRSTFREPTPPTADTKLVKAHEAAEEEEFSIKMRDDLFCPRKHEWGRCGNCERKRVLAELKMMGLEQYIVKGKGFRKRKPTGLWVFPTEVEVVEGVVAVREEV